MLQRWKDGASCACEGAESWTPGGKPDFIEPASSNACSVEPGKCRSASSEFEPGNRTIIRQMPKAALAIDQQIEAGVDQIRQICGGDHDILQRGALLPCLQCTK